MDQEHRRKQSFLLRLPLSVRDQATQMAHEDGTSLNHFISLAVAEKIGRMDHNASQANSDRQAHSKREHGTLSELKLTRSA